MRGDCIACDALLILPPAGILLEIQVDGWVVCVRGGEQAPG